MTVQVCVRPLVLAVMLALPAAGLAQTEVPAADEPSAEAPPHVVRLDGSGAEIVRDGVPRALELGEPILYGDRIDAGQAFAQVLWGDGSRIAIGRGGRLEALAEDLLAVTAGHALVTRPAAVTAALRIDTPAGTLLLGPGGEYRIVLDGETTTLAVVRGRADVQTGMGEQAVEAGHRLAMRDGIAPPAPTRAAAAGYDSFVEWANRPPTAPAAGAPLETFQDPQFEAYTDVFNSYGAWETDPRYGAVWYPQVAAGWRPYADGYWHPYGPQSQWLWVGRDPWGWPTHHYGRWGTNPQGRWFWMPGRQFAPSWVTWSVGPGYIGWTPLGHDDRPQWGWDAVTQPRGAYAGGTLDPSRAWTVVPSDQFGQRGRLGAHAVDPRTIDNLSAFVSQRVGPPVRYAVPRGAGYGYGAGVAPYGGSGGTTVYGPGGYYGGVRPRGGGGDTTGQIRGGIGPTRVGPPSPGYGGPTPPAEDPYERAQRAVAPRGRQRTPAAAEPPSTPSTPSAPSTPSTPAPDEPAPASDAPRQRTPPREGPATPPAASESTPSPRAAAPTATPAPPATERAAASSSTTRATGATTGRRAIPRPR